MRKYVTLLVAGLCGAVCVSPVRAASDTLTGEVISVSCFLQNKANVGKTGFVCAVGDVKWEGNPPGLLTADGKMYQLAGGLVANNNAKVAPHIGHTVTITGDVTQKDGLFILTASDLKMVSK